MLTLIETRNRHFLESCRRIMRSLPSGEEINLMRVAMAAAKSPAPHYYCTFTYALRMLRVLRHGRIRLKRDRRLDMWEELDAKCSRYMERHGCRLPEACVMYSPPRVPRSFSSLPLLPCGSCSV